jgi:type I restriction enzyme S subunit
MSESAFFDEGSLPSGWSTRRLRFLVSINNAKLSEATAIGRPLRYMDISSVGGDGSKHEAQEMLFEDAPSRARRLARAGDTAISTVRTYLKAITYVDEEYADCVWSTGFAIISPGPELNSRFLYHVTRSKWFVDEIQRRSVGVGYPAINAEDIGDILCPLPPVREQNRIANLLDAEVARLDQLKDLRTRTIDLLGERLKALRAFLVLGQDHTDLEATTHRGLPPVPADWLVAPLRRFDVEVQTGPFGSQLHASDYTSGGIPVVNPANLQAGRIMPNERVAVDERTRERLARHALRRGDVVFARRGELGRAALVTEAEDGWLCGTGCLRARLRGRSLSSRFLSLYLNLDVIRQYFESFSVGSTLDNLNSELLLGMPVVVPPPREQERIADEVEKEVASHEQLLDLMRRHVDLVLERREALITSAVTGQLDPTSYTASALTS